ncbi:MAG: NAD(P)H-hydrate dehydratase [Chloroflexi bacterium]|nr:NAD(P)H-hydrate dehydratase [Chloroflexota bacterium]
MKIVTVQQMRALEQAADAQGLSYAAMMERAGQAVASWITRRGVVGQQVLVLVGPGNNGGDGLVAARCLQEAGAVVSVYCWQRETSEDENWSRALSAGIPIFLSAEDGRYAKLRRLVADTDYILDALLGTGASRPITGALQDILAVVRQGIEKRRARQTSDVLLPVLPARPTVRQGAAPLVVAVDVPSGLNCDTGAVDAATLPADVTVTFAYPKMGQFLFPGAAYLGELVVADIGIPARLAKSVDLEVSTAGSIRSLLPRRPMDAHKGTFGKVMVVAGSPNYTGAACLAARAATRVGAGLVTLGIAGLLHPILAGKLSETTFLLLPHDMGSLVPEAAGSLLENLGGYDALLLGPGLGREAETVEFVARLLSLSVAEKKDRLGFVASTVQRMETGSPLPPVVIDADGLNALADIEGWHECLHVPAVLTPHPGEMARLLRCTVADVEANRVEVARRAARQWQTVVVLKGAYSVIASPEGPACINPFASPALATAGTGDVLAGAIAGLLAQGLACFEAAVLGTYLHGLAGQIVGEEMGVAGAVASDLLTRLPQAIRHISGV